MSHAVGESVPFALGIALSTLPIVALVITLLSKRSLLAGWTFVAGWVTGTALLVVVVVFASDALGASTAGPKPRWASIVRILVGGLLLALAARDWHLRPKPGHPPHLPRWLKAVDELSPMRAAGFGLTLSTANPKNLLLVLGGGLAIAAAHAGLSGEIVAGVIFVLVATAPAVLFAVANLLLQTKAPAALDAVDTWLRRHNALLMAIVLLVLGLLLIVGGATSL